MVCPKTQLLVMAALLLLATAELHAQATPAALQRIAGRVLGDDGTAIAGAKVEADADGTQEVRRTTTDSAGRYAFVFKATSDSFTVTASAASHLTRVGRVTGLGVNGMTVNFTLPLGNPEADTARLRTTIADASAKAVAREVAIQKNG